MFTSNSIPMFTNQSVERDELSMEDIQNLLNNRKKDETIQIQGYKESDVLELENFCKTHGIVGFNCGNMSPKAALQILKRKVGFIEQKQHENSISTKQILHG